QTCALPIFLGGPDPPRPRRADRSPPGDHLRHRRRGPRLGRVRRAGGAVRRSGVRRQAGPPLRSRVGEGGAGVPPGGPAPMIPPSTTITEEGRRTRRALLWLAGLVVAVNLLAWGITRLTSGRGVDGPDGSSYVTTPDGAAAVEGLLDRLGVATVRIRRPLDEIELDPAGTLLALDVSSSPYTSSELEAIDEFMAAGGRLVVAGQAEFGERLFPDAPRWRTAGADSAQSVGDVAVVGEEVRLGRFGSFEVTAADAPFLTDGNTVIGVSRRVGRGTFVWIADSFPFHNGGIGRGRNAVAVVGMIDPAGPVYFDEYRHGYRDDASLWDVIPSGWQTALLLGAVVVALALVAYGRRFGPPYDLERRLPPGRETYLESVAGILSRAGAVSDSLEVLREEALRRLSERGDPRAAAVAAGLEDAEIEALF